MNKIITGIFWGIAFILASFSLVQLFEQSPMTYEDLPFQITNTTHYQGDHLTFDVKRCASKETPYSFTLHFKNLDTGEVTTLAGATASAPKGCMIVKSTPKYIPEDLEPGRYMIRGAAYVQGRYKTFNVPFRTTEFTVTEKP